MTTNSINNNGCSVCETGKENYSTVIAGAYSEAQNTTNTTTATPMGIHSAQSPNH